MYEEGQLENELKVLRKVVKKMTALNVELSRINIARTSFVVAYSDMQRELEKRESMMKLYKTEGYF
jgi:hypothetical protein